MRLTTPSVTLMVLPPMGNPRTLTRDCSGGKRSDHSTGARPSKKLPSTSSSSARSTSGPTATTRAAKRLATPDFVSRMSTASSITWKFVRIWRPPITKPEPMRHSCCVFSHGRR
eukprot:1164824-Prymnesium_polylepis.1